MTYIFAHKNSSVVLTISAESFIDAEYELTYLVNDIYAWRCDNEEGEHEN